MLSGLEQLQRFTRSSAEARRLIAEVEAGSPRSDGIRVFLQSLDAALHDLYADEAAGIVPSKHHPTLPQYLAIFDRMCATVSLMRKARKIVVRPADCGLFGGFLGVLDALLLAPPDVALEVDWRLTGNEQHFTYLPPPDGEPCVWRSLFDPIDRPGVSDHSGPRDRERADRDVLAVTARLNCFFVSRFRWLSRYCPDEAAQRAAYHRVYATHVRPRHPRLLALLTDLTGQMARAKAALAGSGVSVGVHKRVETPGTMEYQGCGRVFNAADFIEALRRLGRALPRPIACIFLATDDARAEDQFRASEFGARLLLHRGVQRVAGGLNDDGTLNEGVL